MNLKPKLGDRISAAWRSFARGPENASKQISREKDLLIQLIRRQVSLYRKDIKKWRDAHTAALNPERPLRVQLYEVYDDAMLDAHLSTVVEARQLNIEQTPFYIVDENGEKDEEITKLLQKRWVLRYNRYALESRFYGYSLIKLCFGEDMTIYDVIRFPREHVVPEFGVVKPDVYGDKQLPYTNPPENLHYIGVGEPFDLGLLLKAAPYCIYKKNALAHWSKFQEIYGIPPRIATTDSRDTKVQAEIVKWLEEMGSSAYGLFPKGTEFEKLDVASTDAYKVFDMQIDRINQELSKLILLQTMTTDNGSSRSQSEVHERKEEKVENSDLSFIEFEWNDKLIPILIQHGYQLEGKRFMFDRSRALEAPEQWKIVNDLLNQGYEVEDDYIRQTFYVPVIGRDKTMIRKPAAPGEQEEEQEEEEKGNKKPGKYTSLHDELQALYGGHAH